MAGSPSEREAFQISLLKTLLQSYFGVVRKSVADLTVKIVWRNVVEKVFVFFLFSSFFFILFLVCQAKNDLQRQLMADLYKPELFDSLLSENPQIHSQRTMFK